MCEPCYQVVAAVILGGISIASLLTLFGICVWVHEGYTIAVNAWKQNQKARGES